ncbi:TPA: conjugal transfer protein, partial [Salmonella enterica subsp. enterica serovar Enteritidis]
MKRICKGLIVIFTVSWLTAPAYASDPCASVLCL